MDIRLVHLDTISVSVKGAYDEGGPAESFRLAYGHSKDRCPGLKRIKIGLAMRQGRNTLPGTVLPGTPRQGSAPSGGSSFRRGPRRKSKNHLRRQGRNLGGLASPCRTRSRLPARAPRRQRPGTPYPDRFGEKGQDPRVGRTEKASADGKDPSGVPPDSWRSSVWATRAASATPVGTPTHSPKPRVSTGASIYRVTAKMDSSDQNHSQARLEVRKVGSISTTKGRHREVPSPFPSYSIGRKW